MNRGIAWNLSFSTSSGMCRNAAPYRISQVRSPLGLAYPILWTLGRDTYTVAGRLSDTLAHDGTGGLGCGFLKVTSERSPRGITVTETVLLTDAVTSRATRFEELACSGGRVVPATTDPAQTGADLAPHATAARIASEWRAELAKTPRKPVMAPSTTTAHAVLLGRLHEAAALHGFEVVSVQMLQNKLIAPLIVVKTDHPTRLTNAMTEILARIDPQAGTQNPAYAGLFFQALDSGGDPFMAVYDWRAGGEHRRAGGGQWAANGRLPLRDGYQSTRALSLVFSRAYAEPGAKLQAFQPPDVLRWKPGQRTGIDVFLIPMTAARELAPTGGFGPGTGNLSAHPYYLGKLIVDGHGVGRVHFTLPSAVRAGRWTTFLRAPGAPGRAADFASTTRNTPDGTDPAKTILRIGPAPQNQQSAAHQRTLDCKALYGKLVELSAEPAYSADYLQRWTTREGCPVRLDVIMKRQGARSCGGERVADILMSWPLGQIRESHGTYRIFVRDPDGVMGDKETSAAFNSDAELPADAVDTGFRQGRSALWMRPNDGSFLYPVTGNRVEAWPYDPSPTGCA